MNAVFTEERPTSSSLDDDMLLAAMTPEAYSTAVLNKALHAQAATEISAALKCLGLKVRLETWEALQGSPLVKYSTILQLPSIWQGMNLRLAPALMSYWLYGKFGVGGTATPPGVLEIAKGDRPVLQIEPDWVLNGRVGQLANSAIAEIQLEMRQLATNPDKFVAMIKAPNGGNRESWDTISNPKRLPKKPCNFGYPTRAVSPSVQCGDNRVIGFMKYLPSDDLKFWSKINSSIPDFECFVSLGDFSIQGFVSGELHRIDATNVGVTIRQFTWRVRDSYDFVDRAFDMLNWKTWKSQWLGSWTKSGLSIFGEYLDNATFRSFSSSGKKLVNDFLEANADRCVEAAKHQLKCVDFGIVTRPISRAIEPPIEFSITL